MTDAAYRPTGGMAVDPPPTAQADVDVRRWQSFCIAVGSLILVLGVGLLVMLLGGVFIHALAPNSHLDGFAALHNHWVITALLGAAVLWLLPPHPWAKHVIAQLPQEQPARAGGTEAVPN